MDEVRLANERQDSADRQARSQDQADNAMRQKREAEADTMRAQAATAQAETDMTNARAARAQAESDAANAQAAKAQAEADAANARNDATDAQAATARANADAAVNQASSASALSAAQADADRSRAAAQQADADKAAMRTKLAEQLNSILQTRETARGLIVSMSDVLFDTGKYSLKPGAREKLAKVAGILLSYPGLNIEVGGYTDNVGGDSMNQTLSENRASSVRDYLVQQGVASGAVSSKGFGNTLPVASNDDSAGRQQNRRVELLVSGAAIGTPVNAPTGSLR